MTSSLSALFKCSINFQSSGVTSEAESDDGSLTEIESTCSGLSDLSGVSDLDVHFEDAPEGVVDFGMEEDVWFKF